MTYTLQDKKNELANYRKWGVGLVSTIFGIGLFIFELRRIWPPEPKDYSFIALFVICGCLIFLWVWATQKELDLLFAWRDPQRYSPPSGFKESATIVGISLLLALLMISARDPLWFGGIFTLYNLSVLFAVIDLNKELRKAIDKSKERIQKSEFIQDSGTLSATRFNAILILEKYFLQRPHTPRHIAIVIFGALGVLFAFLAKFGITELFKVSAYLIFIFSIVCSELWIAKWRLDRENSLREIEAIMRELNQTDKN